MVRSSVIILVFILASCTATKRTTKTIEQRDTTEVVQLSAVDSLMQTVITQMQLSRDRETLTELVSNLNLAYDGKQGDSLLVQLLEDVNGLKLRISGSGQANFSRTLESRIEDLESYLMHRQDSIRQRIDAVIDTVSSFNQETKEEIKKENLWKGFLTPLKWVLIGVLIGFIISVRRR